MSKASQIEPRPARRAAAAFALAALLCSGCNVGYSRPGKIGMTAPCEPVCQPDPFPNDECTPPKTVQPPHFGYTRTQWRVLGERLLPCCGELPAEPVPAPLPAAPIESEPAEAAEPDEPVPAESVPAPLLTPVGRRPVPAKMTFSDGA
jgi:hypothetical protein